MQSSLQRPKRSNPINKISSVPFPQPSTPYNNAFSPPAQVPILVFLGRGGIVDVGRGDLLQREQLSGRLKGVASSVPAHGPQTVDASADGVPEGLERAADAEHGRGAVEREAGGDNGGVGRSDALLVEANRPGGRRHVEDGVGPGGGVGAERERVGNPLGGGAGVLLCEGKTG